MELETQSASTSAPAVSTDTKETHVAKNTSRKLFIFLLVLLLLLAAGVGAFVMYLLTSKDLGERTSTITSSISSSSLVSSSVTSSAVNSVSSSQTTSALPAINKASTQFGISMNVPSVFAYTEDVGKIVINGEDQGSPWDRGAYSIVIDKRATAAVIADLQLGYTDPVPSESFMIGSKTYLSQMMSSAEGVEEGSTYWSVQLVNVDNKFTILIHKKIESVGDGEVLNQPTTRDINGGLQLLASIKFK